MNMMEFIKLHTHARLGNSSEDLYIILNFDEDSSNDDELNVPNVKIFIQIIKRKVQRSQTPSNQNSFIFIDSY